MGSAWLNNPSVKQLLHILLLLSSFSACRAQFPTLAPTERCTWEGRLVADCMQVSALDLQACADCHNRYEESLTSETTCPELTALVCDQIAECGGSRGPCGFCGALIEDYVQCQIGSDCFGECSSTPAPSPDPCEGSMNAFAACVSASGESEAACYSCLDAYLPETISSCDESETVTCGANEACPQCGDCEAEHAAWTNCLNVGECDAFSCSFTTPPTPRPTSRTSSTAPTSTPTTSRRPSRPPAVAPSAVTAPTDPPAGEPCEGSMNAFAACVSTSGESEAACYFCLDTYLSGPIASCDESETYTCGANEACPQCGDCEAEYAAWANCLNVGVCDAFYCSSTTPPTPRPTRTPRPTPRQTAVSPVASPPSPVISPVSNATDGGGTEKCPNELGQVQDCVFFELSTADAESCEACVNDALQAVFPGSGEVPSCADIHSGLCPALSSSDGACNECRTCSDEILSYVACEVEAVTTGCEIDCRSDGESDAPSDVPSVAPSPASPGLRPAARLRLARLLG